MGRVTSRFFPISDGYHSGHLENHLVITNFAESILEWPTDTQLNIQGIY
jgi:hypothetical protein